MSDSEEEEEEENFKEINYINEIRIEYEKDSYYNKIENASINLVENLKEYLENTGSELYNRVQRVDFSMKFYNIILEIIEKNK